MKLVIGFITYNNDSAKYLPYFLDSLFKALEGFSREDVLVLARDNSEDPDNYNREYIENIFNKDEKLINFRWSGENVGFAKCFNIMIQEASIFGADFFLMINPDTVLAPDSIYKMISVINSDKMLGSVAPKILRWDFANLRLTKVIDSCGLKLNSGLSFIDIGQGVFDAGQFDEALILGPSGAAALFRMSALNEIKEETGYLDERMFMYKEDCDLAYRLFLGGFSSKLVPDSLIYHDRSASSLGNGVLSILKNRSTKSRQVRSWSFLNQHLLFIKFWSKQPVDNKIKIVFRVLIFFAFALLKEPFLLKNYTKISKYYHK